MTPLSAVIRGGLVAGSLDLLYAFVAYGLRGVTPLRNLQSIASGLLGREAYQGGLWAASLGLLLHFLILIAAAALYQAVARRLVWPLRHAVVAGLAYGACIYAFMNLVVVPLSAFPYKLRFDALDFALSLAVHMVCVGLPIALFARAASRPSIPLVPDMAKR